MAKGSRGGRRTSLGKGGGVSANDIVSVESLVSKREGMRSEVDAVLSVSRDIYSSFGLEVEDIHIATMKGKGKMVMGYYDGSNIAINKSYFNNKNMENAYSACVKSGFHPSQGKKTALQAVTAHELGHALTDKIVNEKKMDEKTIISKASKMTGHGQDHISFASKISGYAKVSNSECIAEAFADVYCNGSKAKKESKAIVDIMKGK